MRHLTFTGPARKLLPFSKFPSPSLTLKSRYPVGFHVAFRGKSSLAKDKVKTHQNATPTPKTALPHRRFTPPTPNARPLGLFALTATTTSTPRFINKTDPSQLLLFCNGIHRTPPIPSSLGVCFSHKGNLSATLTPTTDGTGYTYNSAQLQAAITALQYRDWQAEGFAKVVVACSVPYLVDGVSGRADTWANRGWRTVEDLPVANSEFWVDLLSVIKGLERKGLVVQFWAIRKLDNLAVELSEDAVVPEIVEEMTVEEMVGRRNNRRRMVGLLLVGGAGITMGLIAMKFDVDIGDLGFK